MSVYKGGEAQYYDGQAGHAGGTLPGWGPSWWGGHTRGRPTTPNTATVSLCGGPIWRRDTRLSWSMGIIINQGSQWWLRLSDKGASKWKCITGWKWVGIWQGWWLWDPSDLICAIVPALKGAAYPRHQVQPSGGLVWSDSRRRRMVSWRLPRFLLPTCLLWHTKRGKPGWNQFLGDFCQRVKKYFFYGQADCKDSWKLWPFSPLKYDSLIKRDITKWWRGLKMPF